MHISHTHINSAVKLGEACTAIDNENKYCNVIDMDTCKLSKQCNNITNEQRHGEFQQRHGEFQQ